MFCSVAYRDVCLWSTVVGQHEDGLPAVGEVVCTLAAVVALVIRSLRTASHFWTRLEQPKGKGWGDDVMLLRIGGNILIYVMYVCMFVVVYVHLCVS